MLRFPLHLIHIKRLRKNKDVIQTANLSVLVPTTYIYIYIYIIKSTLYYTFVILMYFSSMLSSSCKLLVTLTV